MKYIPQREIVSRNYAFFVERKGGKITCRMHNMFRVTYEIFFFINTGIRHKSKDFDPGEKGVYRCFVCVFRKITEISPPLFKWTAQSNWAACRYCGGSGLFAFRISWSPARACSPRRFTIPFLEEGNYRVWPNSNSFFYWTMWCWDSDSCPQGNWMSMLGHLLLWDSMMMKKHLLIFCWFEFVNERKHKNKKLHVLINAKCLLYNRDAFRISWTRLSMDESKRPTPAACTDRVNSVRRRAPKDRRSRATFATPAPHTWPIPPTGWPTLTTTTT